MESVLSLVTVAARFRAGELANSDGEMGAGKVLWLKRPALGRSADIAFSLVVICWQDPLRDRHGFQEGQAVDILELSVVLFVVAVLIHQIGRRVWGLFPPTTTDSKIQCGYSAQDSRPKRPFIYD